jgi:uncharacterized protein (DUF2141 family)
MGNIRLAVLGFAVCAIATQAYTAVADPPGQTDAGSAKPAAPPDAGSSKPAVTADAGSGKTAVARSDAAAPRTSITVYINGLRNDQGLVFVALFDSKRGFDDKKPVAGGRTRPATRSAVVVLENVVPGTYALSFIHDENENKKLDTNFLGIPTEGFGFANNAMGLFGPPSFESASVKVPAGGANVAIRAKYF